MGMHRRQQLLLALVLTSSCSAHFLSVPKGLTGPRRKTLDGSVRAGDESPAQGRQAASHTQPLWPPLSLLRCSISATAVSLALPAWRMGRRVWEMLPRRLPRWWTSSISLSEDLWERALFLLSNASYLYGALLLWTTGSSPVLGTLMLAVGAVSTAYHVAQCTDGCESTKAARMLIVDVAMAVAATAGFALRGRPNTGTVMLGLLSLIMFFDVPRLGYAASHSLWHVSSATMACVSVLTVRR